MTDNSIEMTSPKVARTGSRAPLSVVSSLTSTPSDALAPAAQMGVRRRTLKSAIDCTGIGLHGGKKIHMTLRPADAGTGIVFRRADLFGPDGSVPAKAIIPGRYDSVADCRMCTTIANASGTTISTVEHLMAALAGNGIDDLIVDVSGPEIPVMDGSSGPFLFLID
ncbi:MAG: UDP-3-O-acyl-N-acetylglucosamine deacetylase, partial [Rhodospirillaceae bacterium]